MRIRGTGEISVLALAGVALAVAWISTGSDPGVTLWWLAVVAFGVLLPGWALVRCVRGGDIRSTDLAWAGPAGLVVTLATWLVAHLIGQHLPMLLVGPLIAAGLLVVPVTRRRTLGDVRRASEPWPLLAWASIVLVVLGTVRWMWVAGLSSVAPRPTAAYQIYYQDLLYQTALTGELRRNLDPGYPMVAGEPLGYHWFYHAVAAQLSGTGLDDLDVVTRLLPATLVVILVLLAAAVGRQVTGHWTGGVGAAAVVALVRPAAADTWGGSTPIVPVGGYWQLSPTATLGWVLGLALVGCLLAVLRRSPRDALAPGALLPFFAMGAAGAKSAQLPVILCGVALAALVVLGLEWRRARRERASRPEGGAGLRSLAIRYAVCLGGLVVITLLAVRFIYPGSYGLRLDLSAWPVGQASVLYGSPDVGGSAEALAAGVSFARRWAPTVLPALGLVVLVRRRPRDPAGWLGIGMLLGGAAAATALVHPSGSQLYFPIGALPIAYALSGAGIAEVLRTELTHRAGARMGSRETWRGVAVVGGLAAAAALSVVAVRRLLPSGGQRPRLSAAAELDRGSTALTWIAPTAAVLCAVLVLSTLAWAVRRRTDAREARGRWVALVAIAGLAVGAPALWKALEPFSVPGPAESVSAATDRYRRPAVTPALFEAGQYLRAHAEPSDVVATNRVWNGVRARRPDNRDFSVSAFSGLRSDVGGYGYAPRMLEETPPGVPYALAPFWDQPRLDAELALVRRPTAQALATAYRTRGVRWIVADERSGPVSAALTRLTDVVSRVDGVWLARLRTPTS